MAEQQISLVTFYKGWDIYQDLLIQAIAPLSLEQLALEPAPHLRSVGQNAAHIVGTRAGWLHFNLGQGGDKMPPLAYWNAPNQPARTAAQLVRGLEDTWEVIQDTLKAWSLPDLAVTVQDTDDNGEVHTYTRQWVLWHLIEHDMHHGGELSYTLGMHGLPGIPI